MYAEEQVNRARRFVIMIPDGMDIETLIDDDHLDALHELVEELDGEWDEINSDGILPVHCCLNEKSITKEECERLPVIEWAPTSPDESKRKMKK
jgi:hypothetical protein